MGDIVGHQTRATRLSTPQPAEPWLRQLGTRLLAGECDGAHGKFALIHYVRWVDASKGGPKAEIVMRWHADDASGAELAVQYPPGPVQVLHRYWHPGDLIQLGTGDPLAHTDYLWWEIDPAYAGTTQPDEVLERLADLGTWYSPQIGGRRAALAVLAATNGLTFYDRATDRAGRRGVGITATTAHGAVRYLLILQPTTGEVLAYEMTQRTASTRKTLVYILFLSHSRAERRYWEPAHPSDGAPPLRQYLHPSLKRRWIDQPVQPCITQPSMAAGAGGPAQVPFYPYGGRF
ncbi:hypothetical protein [Micromonospora sp. WMMD980]|uniref:hypothetical protein n=1 Tax=Micromonospora sp. WMMD980 TaxID=3016088 RepID=UPI002415B308|nr:hypothetical protein [Micromonospora sp. WMMD980]MDG4800506.1 hypothetical protein [Micromonospora sp. WMMD980]